MIPSQLWKTSRHGYRGAVSLVWNIVMLVSTIVAVLFLVMLIFSMLNNIFGYSIIKYQMPLTELLSGKDFESADSEALIRAIRRHVNERIVKHIEKTETLATRSKKNLIMILEKYVLEPEVLVSYSFIESLFSRAEILREASERRSQDSTVALMYRSWLSFSFLISEQSPDPWWSGIRTAILGTLWVICITVLISFPVGVGAAIYLEEYLPRTRFTNLVQVNIYNLSGIPSIIYGLLGLVIFVRFMEPLTSGKLFGIASSHANGRTIISAGCTLSLLILPVIIINAQEAIRAVPHSIRYSSYGVGATKWQTIWHHVLPYSMDRILTGTILAISRAVGETAPLVIVGASTFLTVDPSGIFSKFTTLPIQIYQWASRPQVEFRHLAAAAIVVLLILMLLLNTSAIILRNKISRTSKRT